MPVSAMKNCPSNRTPGGANLGGKVSFGPAFSSSTLVGVLITVVVILVLCGGMGFECYINCDLGVYFTMKWL